MKYRVQWDTRDMFDNPRTVGWEEQTVGFRHCGLRHLEHVCNVPSNPEGLGDGKDSEIQALHSGTL